MMTRFSIKPILAMAALLFVSGLALGAQESKPAVAPKTAPKDAKPKTAAAKEAPAVSKGPKAANKKQAQPQANYNLGEPPAPIKPSAKAAHPKTKSRRSSSKLPMSQRIDINSASKEELMKLPGISEAEAVKIMAHRPYMTKTGLLEFAGLTGAQYFAIKDRVRTGGGSSQTPK